MRQKGYFYAIDPPNAEYVEREHQLPADVNDRSGDTSRRASEAMARARVGEPPTMYDVRSVYDSRPPNAFDFNVSNVINTLSSASGTAVVPFTVPAGFRWVPREWDIMFQPAIPGPIEGVTVSIQYNNANLPYDQNIIVGGGGTARPIKTFFVVDETQVFGVQVTVNNIISVPTGVIVSVYGNSLPVTNVALPYEVTNRIR